MRGYRHRNGAHEGERRLSLETETVSEFSKQTPPLHVVTNDQGSARGKSLVIRGGGNNYKFDHGAGSPFMVSGELFVRSMRELLFNGDLEQRRIDKDPRLKSNILSSIRAENEEAIGESAPGTENSSITHTHPTAGLLARLSSEFHDLLLCHPDLDTSGVVDGDCPTSKMETHRSAAAVSPGKGGGGGNGNGLISLISSASHERRLFRLKKVDRLEMSKKVAKCMATARVLVVEKAVEEFKQRYAQKITRLESNIRGLILRFVASVDAEMGAEDAQTAAKCHHCEREMERLDLAARLASLAATAAHRTQGNVVLRRLPPTHPQHARCVRAATNNVKPGFFSSKSPYGAVRVTDIYKIENKFLLERFQRAAEATESCRVKGLFCHVPGNSLEQVVLYGMDSLREGGATGASGSAHRSAWDEDPIDPLWASRNEGLVRRVVKGQGEHDTISDTLGNFPRTFSRHSTLEEEREYANPPDRTRGMREMSVTTICSNGRRRKEDKNPSTSQRSLDEDGSVSGLRLLALCRVTIGSMYVSSAPSLHRAGGDAVAESIAVRASVRQEAAPPSVESQPSTVLICPPSGQAEFDSVYFPREEEYRLFNKAFVLPEFLVVHRFVARPSPTLSPSSVTNSSRIAAFGDSGNGGGLKTAVDTTSRDKRGVADEVPRGHSNSDNVGTSRTAASVVAGIEAAMIRAQPSRSGMLGTPSYFEASSSPSTDSKVDAGCATGGCDIPVVAAGLGRRQERGSGRPDRDSIVRAVELNFERFWCERDKLRNLEKEEMARLATRAKVPGQPP